MDVAEYVQVLRHRRLEARERGLLGEARALSLAIWDASCGALELVLAGLDELA